MNSHEEQVRTLMAEAARLHGSPVKYALLDEAVRVADAHRDIPLGFEVRSALIWVGAGLGYNDGIAVAFAWCLHHSDTRPELFAGRDILNEYGLVINGVTNFDAVSRPQLQSMIADYAARRERAGHSPAQEWAVWLLAAADLGDRPLAARAADELRRQRQERLLTRGQWFRHAVFLGDTAEAMRLAEAEILSRGFAARFDHEWYELPLLLLTVGRAADARHWLRRGVAQMSRGAAVTGYYWGFGPLAAALALTGQVADAVTLCGVCSRAVHADTDPLTRLHFHLDMGVVFERLHAVGTESVPTRLGDDAPGRLPNGRYRVAEVRDWMANEAAGLADRFDRRNGNDHFAERIRERAGWQGLARPELA